MCRLLTVEGINNSSFSLNTVLPEFAAQCEFNKAPDGSSQEDGSGISIQFDDFEGISVLYKHFANELIQEPDRFQFSFSRETPRLWNLLYLSLDPLWKSVQKIPFSKIPQVKRVVAHARSASVAETKGKLAHNQPHQQDSTIFAFNGSLQNVKLKDFQNRFVRAGRFDKDAVPTLKILNLLQIFKEDFSDEQFPMVVALQELNKVLTEKSDAIHGMNIVVGDENGIYGLCGTHEELDNYYTLHAGTAGDNSDLSIISSFPFGDYELWPMEMGDVFYSDHTAGVRGIEPAML